MKAFELKQVLDRMPYGVIHTDIDGEIVYANLQASFKLRIAQKDIVGNHFLKLAIELVDTQKKPIVEEKHPVSLILEGGHIIVDIDLGIAHKDNFTWVSAYASAIHNEKGKLTGVSWLLLPVKQQIIENKPQKPLFHNRKENKIVDDNEAVFWEANTGKRQFSFIGSRVKKMLGYKQDKWLKEGFWESVIYVEDRQEVSNFDQFMQGRSDSYQMEYRLMHKQGFPVWVKDFVEVVRDNKGAPLTLMGLTMNISKHKNFENQVERNKHRVDKLISEAPFAISIHDKDGLLIAANSVSERVWHKDIGKVTGHYNIFKDRTLFEQGFGPVIKRAFAGNSGDFVSDLIVPNFNNIKKKIRVKYYSLFDEQGDIESVVFLAEDISEYAKTKESFLIGEALKTGILDALDDAILVVDDAKKVLDFNQKMVNLLKMEGKSNMLGKSFEEVSKVMKDDSLVKRIDQVITGARQYFESEHKAFSDGRWYNMRINKLYKPAGVVISLRDVNTRKEIEVALDESLKKYRRIYNKAPVMMHSLNTDGEIISVSDFWLQKMGYQRNEVIGRKLYDFMSEQSVKTNIRDFKKLKKEGEIRNLEYQFVDKKGKQIELILSSSAEYDERGKFINSITGMIDVTRQKEVERKLQKNQLKLLALHRISKMGSFEYDIINDRYESSPEIEEIFGFDKMQKNYKNHINQIHPADRQDLERSLFSSLESGSNIFKIHRIINKKTKEVKWVSVRCMVITDKKRQVHRLIGVMHDISEQRQTESKIQKLTDRMLLATQAGGLGVWEYNFDEKKMHWGDQIYTILETDTQTIDNPGNLKNLLDEEDKIAFYKLLSSFKKNKGVGYFDFDFKILVNGKKKYLRSYTRVTVNRLGVAKNMVGVVYDVTKDKQLQSQLQNSLDEKNILVKEVHHRVKNNIQLISSIMSLKSFDIKDSSSKEIFNDIIERIKAMSVIHDRLYTFHNVSEIDIAEYLNNITDDLKALFGTKLVEISLEAESATVDVDKSLVIGMIVSELVSNAVKHGIVKEKHGCIFVKFEKIAKENYQLLILNGGNKVPKDVLQSTSGLGISLVKTFVNQLQGDVDVTEELDSGMTGFKITF